MCGVVQKELRSYTTIAKCFRALRIIAARVVSLMEMCTLKAYTSGLVKIIDLNRNMWFLKEVGGINYFLDNLSILLAGLRLISLCDKMARSK